jgi:hypothetical protein
MPLQGEKVGVEDAGDHQHGVFDLQTPKLLDHEEQEERSGPPGAKQILPLVSETHAS